MDGSAAQTWMGDILHVITQGLLVPDILLLIAFIGYALFCIGSIVAEYFTERKHFKVTMPKFLAALMAAQDGEIPEVIEKSGLLKRQKVALLTVYDYRMLPGDALMALIKRLVDEEERRYDRITGRNNMAARVSPMLGLMGTLIPLGPGIQALGTANTEQLSASLLIAFDTTVAGLVVAAVCMIIGKIRSIWYGNYMSALDSGMATMLQKIEDMRAEGKISIQEPSDYAFLFEQSFAEKGARKDAGKAEGKAVGAPELAKGDKAPGAPAGIAAGAGAGSGAQSVGVGLRDAVASAGGSKTPGQLASASAPAQADFGRPELSRPALADMPAAPAAAGGEALPLSYGSSAGAAGDASFGAPPAPVPFATDAPYGQSAWSDSPQESVAAIQDAPSSPQFAYEPFTAIAADASFAPVPDPPFISNLAAAAEADAAVSANAGAGSSANAGAGAGMHADAGSATGALPAVAADAPLAGSAGAFQQQRGSHAQDFADEPVKPRQVSGWYQPRAYSGGAGAHAAAEAGGNAGAGAVASAGAAPGRNAAAGSGAGADAGAGTSAGAGEQR